MTIHKEGSATIAITAIVFAVINLLSFYLLSFQAPVISALIFIATLGLLIFIISFFRIPKRTYTVGRRIQVSIFMSPLNVHVNRNPVTGEVVYSEYHKGKYLVAWHPKSSTENERHTVVYRKGNKEVLTKQIAGALAKRIVNYVQPGQQVRQNDEMGFIKFGSRVDILLPLNAKIVTKLGDKPKGGVTVIAEW